MTPKTSGKYTIKQLAEECGVTARTLRHYEDQGLISPERRGQHRIYHQQDKIRLSWILRGKHVGFSLSEIGEMLDLYNLPDGRVQQRATTLDRCRTRVNDLKSQRDDINTTINELEGFCDLLGSLKRSSDGTHWINQNTQKPLKAYSPR
ncbi:MAG: MerR family DNA-binding transcriptional regulator [Kordiimonadaceae bacterium]|nr:MerR family DNA-binding transcriptional regulator [Kordiimonadaceae bacterium]